MTDERLEQLRRQVREIKVAADAERAAFAHDLNLKVGHIELLKRLSLELETTYLIASRELQRRLLHDDLDFTLPYPTTARMKTIILIVNEISKSKTWRSVFETYLRDGNEEALLDVLEDVSWRAFEANETLSTYCQRLEQFPTNPLKTK